MHGSQSQTLIWLIDQQPNPLIRVLTPAIDPGSYTLHGLSGITQLDKHLAHEQPAVIVIGKRVSGIDGFTLCHTLKNTPLTAHVPIILIGLNPQGSDITNAIDAGADTFLCDPLNPLELAARVTLILRRQEKYNGLNQHHEAAHAHLMAELQSARLMSDNIVSNLTHELRTPLLQIKTSVKELKTQGTNDLDQTNKLIDHAYAATLRMEGVVQKLFHFSTAMRSQKVEPFLLQDVIRAVKLQIERDLEQHRHPTPSICVTFDPSALPPVSSERLSITQVLMQLTDNAAKFSDYCQPIHLRAELTGDFVDVSVRDHGIGIDSSQHEAIFAPYYQVDSSSTRRHGGTGLGLAIVKLILDRLSIPIRIDSALGQGTAIHFLLPVTDFNNE